MYYREGKAIDYRVLSRKQWNQRLNNIFWRNINNTSHSLTKAGIEHDLYGCIIETNIDTGDITIDNDEYKRLYKTAGVREQAS